MNIIHSSSVVPSFNTTAPSKSRRTFIRFLSAGVATLAVEGCGGGAGGSGLAAATPAAPIAPATPAAPAVPVVPAAPVVSAPVVPAAPAASPVWQNIPALTFTEGVASSISVASYITGADLAAVTVTLNAASLPAGVTFNSKTYSFDYDGRGAPSATDGIMLTAAVG